MKFHTTGEDLGKDMRSFAEERPLFIRYKQNHAASAVNRIGAKLHCNRCT